MPTRYKLSIAQQLNAAQVAISNSMADASVQKLLAEYGYTAAKLKQGQKLYDTARLAMNIHKKLSGEQQYKTSEVNKITKNALDAYQALAKVARALWQKDKARLAALGLHGAVPKTTAGFLTAAYLLCSTTRPSRTSPPRPIPRDPGRLRLHQDPAGLGAGQDSGPGQDEPGAGDGQGRGPERLPGPAGGPEGSERVDGHVR